MNVREIMTEDVITADPDSSVELVAKTLIEHRISGLPVVRKGRIVGVVSEKDLLFKERDVKQHHLLSLIFNPPDPQIARKNAARTAAEAMTSPAMTIAPNKTVKEAAEVMTEYDVNRLPVVDGGQLVGIVTRADIVRAFVETPLKDAAPASRTPVTA
jgi:CBS domain-containing protein